MCMLLSRTTGGILNRPLVGSGTRWASPGQVSFHVRGDCDAQTVKEKNGLTLSFITEVSWMRKNGNAR
jgi:hypothetical protein